jgi:hypothetical protein
VVVVECVADAEGVARHDAHPPRAAADVDRVRQLDRAPARRLRLASGVRQQCHEGFGAAVGRGYLGAVHLDAEVVDAEAGRGRHEVLDRLDSRPALSDGRGVVRIDDTLGRSRDRIAVGTDAEDDAGVGRSGCQGQPGRLARMKPNSLQRHRLPDSLLAHYDLVEQSGGQRPEIYGTN